MKNITGLKRSSSEKAADCRKRVLEAINKCKADGNITTARVCKEAGVDKSYFSKHPEMRQMLNNAKGSVDTRLKRFQRSDASYETLVKTLRIENINLEKKNTQLDSECQKYKKLCDKQRVEIELLKKDLNGAYAQKLTF